MAKASFDHCPLLPCLVDELAKNDPSRCLYSIPRSANISDGFIDIDAKTFAGAVDRCCWYLEQHLGKGIGFPTLTYMGPQDLVYALVTLACIKTGYKLLLNSPRNTLDAHLHLFEKTDCHTFLLPPSFPLPVVKAILGKREMRVLEIPTFQHWLTDEPSKPYPFSRLFESAKNDPFVILHTSGSTGVPQPIIQRHSTIAAQYAFATLPSNTHKPIYPSMCSGSRVYVSFPLFHCAGIHMLLPASLYAGFTVVLGSFPPTADVADAVHRYGNVQQSCLAPTTLVDLVKSPVHLENLERLDLITFGGGPCPQAVGDLVSAKTRLLNCLGSTECGVLPAQLCDSEDWAYMRTSSLLGAEYRRFSDDLFEQVIVRNSDLAAYQGVFGTFPTLSEWPMKDLYSRHPTKDIWLYRGRTDDIIVFSNGEKLNPIDMEAIVTANPHVGGALISGVGRFQSSLLVEPVKPLTSNVEKGRFLEALWPSIESANVLSPAHGRIHRNMILITNPQKPMLRAGKGTIQRKMTIDLYAEELEALYETAEGPTIGLRNGSPSLFSHDRIEQEVKDVLRSSTDIAINDVPVDANLFDFGLDSLQVILVVRQINERLSVERNKMPIDIRDIYANPTISALVQSVSGALSGRSVSKETRSNFPNLKEILKLHLSGLPVNARPPQIVSPKVRTILLTGSTGTLGSYILDTLGGESKIARVICLNRGKTSSIRQQQSNTDKGLAHVDKTIEFLESDDISQPYLGLPLEAYKRILNDVDLVIHNAWQVDFNLGVSSFERHVKGVRRLIEFSSQSLRRASIFFISSISSVANCPIEYRTDAAAIPERIYESLETPQSTGYGQSKFLSERLLSAACTVSNIPVAICRLGQIAGPISSSGCWPKSEWLPSLIASSEHMRRLPGDLGKIHSLDWMPVDIASRAIVDLVIHMLDSLGPDRSSHKDGPAVFHIVNPKTTTWAELVPTVRHHLEKSLSAHNGGKIEMVSLATWVEELKRASSEATDVRKNPSLKILDFFEDLADPNQQGQAVLDTTNTSKASRTLVDSQPVSPPLMENWLRQWGY